MSHSPSNHESISLELRSNPLNRRLKLSFRPDRGFLVTYPPRTSQRIVKRFVDDHRDWMEQVIARDRQGPGLPTLHNHLKEYPWLYLAGERYTVVFRNAGGLFKVGEGVISVFPEITDQQLVKKLRKLAEEPLKSLIWRLSEQQRVSVASVQIRDQKSRWGSCSGRKQISLNWRLILMPPGLQQHIILHELAHLIHPDHSPQFWSLLESWDPDFHENKRLLRQQGKTWIQLGRINTGC